MAPPRPAPSAPRQTPPPPLKRHERWLFAGLLGLHTLLAIHVARENSVTFDENFHVPAGVRILRAGDFATSYAQPPLGKALYAVAALGAGARDPGPAQAGPGRERFVGYAFMRANADRYQRIFEAARLVALGFSLALAILVWRMGRALYGPRAGLLALGLWTVLPETLAHAALAGVDLPTGLAFFGAALAWLGFLRHGSWRAWAGVALWTAAAFLTRFSAVQLFPALLLVTALAVRRGAATNPRRAWLGLALLPLVAVVALDLGYLFQVSLRPLDAWTFHSESFHALQQAAPWLRLPLPDAWLEGMDYLTLLSQPGMKQSYLLGEVRDHHSWSYFPVAIAVKWPLGFLTLLAIRAWSAWRDRGNRTLMIEPATLLIFAAVMLLSSMAANLDYGVRYLFPLLPFLCVWVAGLAAQPAGAKARRLALAGALLAAIAVESARALPYPLAFFNALAGGPGRGDRIVNDSNVDWGQGLIALRRNLERLGLRRVHLAYHGTADPGLYGIDYTIYTGGTPGPEIEWLAVSSYFLVGLPARLTTMRGMSEQFVSYDFAALRDREPVARPAYCMYLFRVR